MSHSRSLSCLIIALNCALFRNSRSEAFCTKGVLENFAKLAGEHLYQSLPFNKVAGLRLLG